jgi:hypothetical protein
MPIRVNLLAEAQALEEDRRRDPVKRALLGAALAVVCVLFWSGMLQMKIVFARSDLGSLQAKWTQIEKSYQAVVEHRRAMIEAEDKLQALDQYSTNRFLWGTALNALQQSLLGVEGVHFTRFRTEQLFTLTEEPPPPGKPEAAKPATATEKISMTIDALDGSLQPGGEMITRFKEVLTRIPYFQATLHKTNGVLLTSRSAPQAGPMASTPYVTFTFQCSLPERVR